MDPFVESGVRINDAVLAGVVWEAAEASGGPPIHNPLPASGRGRICIVNAHWDTGGVESRC